MTTNTEPTRGASRIRPLALLRRRWWLLVLTTIAVTAAAYAASSVKKESHTAESLAVVPAGSTTTGGPGSANDAEQLATTYAALIPQDARILKAVARDTRLPVGEVADQVTVVNTADTALLALRFKDPDAQRAVDGARSLARAVDDGTSPNIPRRTMGVVKMAAKPLDDSPGGSRAGLLAGVLVGLFLGAVAMVFLERADARGDDDRDFEDALGLPATALGRRSVGPQVPLVDRWEQVATRTPGRIAFVPATRAAARPARQAAEALAEAACERGRFVAVEAGAPTGRRVLVADGGGGLVDAPHEAMVIAPAAGPGGDPSGESVGLSSDVVVLVVRRGDSLAAAGARLASLRGLGIEVERVLVAPRRMRVQSGRPEHA
jgi:capsular polysaccharide biosynthesis protein